MPESSEDKTTFVDAIFIDGLKKLGLYDKVWQAGAMLLPVNSVGVMGDERTYEKCVALRAVESTDGMTADWVNLPYEFLPATSNEIINKVKKTVNDKTGINLELEIKSNSSIRTNVQIRKLIVDICTLANTS